MSEAHGTSGDLSAANGQLTGSAGQDTDATADGSWFEPVVRSADPGHGVDGPGSGGLISADNGHAHGGPHTAGWFLPTGRAGLLPDSMTEFWDEDGHAPNRPETTADPPWAGERTAVTHHAPPPWESGPWPGAGEPRPDEHDEQSAAEEPAHEDVAISADSGNWQATAALATGILPLVVPGIALGVLGLRRAAVTGTGRAWSWLGISLSVIWAVVLVVFLTSGGQPARACGSAQNGVNYAVSQVLHDLNSGAPQSVLAQDLEHAIGQANSAAAAAPQVSVRDALVALTAGLQQSLAAASGSHSSSYASIRAQVTSAMTAVTAACKA